MRDHNGNAPIDGPGFVEGLARTPDYTSRAGVDRRAAGFQDMIASCAESIYEACLLAIALRLCLVE